MSGMDGRERMRPFLWFALYELLNLGAAAGSVKVSTTQLSNIMGSSQQSASRHLKLLEQMGLITRRIESDGSLIKITGDGMEALKKVYDVLKMEIEIRKEETFLFEGIVFSGMYQGAYYLAQGDYRDQIKEKLGFDPYLGTLNLRLREDDLEQRRRVDRMPAIVLKGFKSRDRAFGGARCYPLVVNDEVEGALIVADRTVYDLSVMEIIAPISLRSHFDLEDGDTVRVSISGPPRSSS